VDAARKTGTTSTQLLVVLSLSVAAFAAAATLHAANPFLFKRFTGGVHPLVAFALAGVLALACFRWLLAGGELVVYGRSTIAELSRYAAIVAFMVSITILVDVTMPFAANINVLAPESLLFYPAMAFLVEIIFHVLPLTVLLMILKASLSGTSRQSQVWIAIVIVSLLEPVYQGLYMSGSGRFPLWAVAVIAANLTAFNLLQLYVFNRYDFISMYAMRLVYYALWHVAWGSIRVPLLFGTK